MRVQVAPVGDDGGLERSNVCSHLNAVGQITTTRAAGVRVEREPAGVEAVARHTVARLAGRRFCHTVVLHTVVKEVADRDRCKGMLMP